VQVTPKAQLDGPKRRGSRKASVQINDDLPSFN
jgi:hypothetical protein